MEERIRELNVVLVYLKPAPKLTWLKCLETMSSVRFSVAIGVVALVVSRNDQSS